MGQFMSSIATVAAISLALNYPTIASVAHSLVNSYKNLLAVRLSLLPRPSLRACRRRRED